MNAQAKPAADRWPPQIKYIVGNEACERFSYYGMRSILAGYITGAVVKGGLGQDADTSTTIIHTFIFANYFMPLFGAWLSDRIIGRYHTILWVSLFYCAGHGMLACSDFASSVQGKMIFLVAGLGLIAFGSGGIKPCVSAFMGDQFKPEQSHLLQKAYGAFYWAINFGSFFSFLVVPWVKDHHGYSWAFGVPGILMGIATLVFALGTKYYVRVAPSRQTKRAGFMPVFREAFRNYQGDEFGPLANLMTTIGLPLIAMVLLTVVAFLPNTTRAQWMVVLSFGGPALICVALWYVLVVVFSTRGWMRLKDTFWQGARGRYSDDEIDAAKSLSPILFVLALIPVFWSLFDQSNSTWVLQGEKMVPYQIASGDIGFTIGAEQMQSANPLLVMILVPLLTLGVYPRIGRWASPLRRMSVGMFIASFSYVIVAMLQSRVEAGAHISVLWQTVPYIVLTTAEVLISTTGLEFAFREAAPEMKSILMSLWLVTVAFGNILVAGITKVFAGSSAGAHEESVSTGRFFLYAGLTFVVAILFSIVAAFYQYRDRAAAEGK
jgi:proton-dependent oligopeptide transporter, POT family